MHSLASSRIDRNSPAAVLNSGLVEVRIHRSAGDLKLLMVVMTRACSQILPNNSQQIIGRPSLNKLEPACQRLPRRGPHRSTLELNTGVRQLRHHTRLPQLDAAADAYAATREPRGDRLLAEVMSQVQQPGPDLHVQATAAAACYKLSCYCTIYDLGKWHAVFVLSQVERSCLFRSKDRSTANLPS